MVQNKIQTFKREEWLIHWIRSRKFGFRSKSQILDLIRHTFASLCYAAKMQPKTVQMLMGHANYSTTIDIYTHIGEDFKQEDIDKFNSLVLNDDAGKTVHEMID